jgi:hypothetical protein
MSYISYFCTVATSAGENSTMVFLTFPETFLHVFRVESGACTAAQPATLLLLMTAQHSLAPRYRSGGVSRKESRDIFVQTTVLYSLQLSRKRPPAPPFLLSDSLFGPYFYFDRQAPAVPTRPATLQPFPSISTSNRQHVKRIHLCRDLRTLGKEGSVPSDP